MKTLDHLVVQLNRALELDREAVTALVSHRVQVNTTLAADAEAALVVLDEGDELLLGVVGLINSLCDDGDPFIAAVYDAESESELMYFTLITRNVESNDTSNSS